MFTLRIELKENFERFTSIYASLSNISISGLFSVGKEVIRECEEKLSQLAKGEILGHIESMRYVNERFEKAKNSVITTHLVRDISNLSCWLSPDFINWMKKNKKSEVVFTIFFILDNEVFKNSGDCEKLVLTLKKQQESGVNVKIVVWDDELQKEFAREFIIYDSHSVITLDLAPCGKYEGICISKDSGVINKYKDRVKKLELRQQSIEDFLESGMEEFCRVAN